MNRKLLGVCLGALVVAGAAVAWSQDKGGGAGHQDMEAMMKEWQAMMNPGAPHQQLERFIGKWNVTMRMYMMPGAPPMESKGEATYEWVLGKRFVQQRYKGEMPMPGADGAMHLAPFEGLGMMGFDNFKKMYVGTWADNMGTHLLSYRCAPNPTIQGMDCYGEMDEPTLSMQDRLVKYETRIIDPSKHVMTVYDLAVGPHYKVVEITYQR